MAKALVVEIFGDAKQFGAELDKAAGKTKRFGAAAGVAGAAIIGGLAVGLEKSVVAAGHFQSSMELIHTQAGVSQKAVDQLGHAVLALAGSVGTAPQELTTGLYHLTSQGLRGAKAMDALKIAAEGAKVGQANLEDVTNALGGVLVSGIKGTKNYSQAMGVLNATVGAGDMRMQDLADAMGTGLPAAAATAHVSLQQISGALAVFGDNNIRGAKAGTLLISTLRVLGHQSTAGAAALADLGVSSTTLQQKLANGGLTTAIEYLTQRIQDSGKAGYQVSSDLSEAFGGKQATGIKILIQELARLKTKVADVGQGGNKFGSDWQAYSRTAQAATDRLKASLQAIEISIGSALLPTVARVTAAIAKLAEWIAKHNAVAKIAVAVIAAFGVALLAASAAALINPFTLVAVALVALGAAFTYAMTHSQAFHDAILGAWNEIKAWTQTHWPEIKRVIVENLKAMWQAAKAIIDAFKVGWREFGSTIKTIARNDFEAIIQIVKSVAQVIRGVAEVIKGIAHGNWALAWKGLKDIVGGVFNAIYTLLRNAGQNFSALISKLGSIALAAFKGAWAAAWRAAMGAVDSATGGILGDIRSIIGALGKLIGWADQAASALSGLGKGKKTNPGRPPVAPPGTPGMALGGIVTRPTFALIGEAGPEAVIPLNKLGGGGPNITVNVGPVYGTLDDSFADQLSNKLAAHLRGGRAPALQQAIHAL